MNLLGNSRIPLCRDPPVKLGDDIVGNSRILGILNSRQRLSKKKARHVRRILLPHAADRIHNSSKRAAVKGVHKPRQQI